MKIKHLIIAVLATSALVFADPEAEALVQKKCNTDVNSWQTTFQTALATGKMDVGSAALYGKLGTKCIKLVAEEIYHKKNGKNPKEEMQKIYSQWGERALDILWDVSKASLAWVKWAAGVELDPIQNEKYVLCLTSDEAINALGFLDAPQEEIMQRTLVGFPGGVPKYTPMSKKMCGKTSGEWLENYQAHFIYRTQTLNSGKTPKELY